MYYLFLVSLNKTIFKTIKIFIQKRYWCSFYLLLDELLPQYIVLNEILLRCVEHYELIRYNFDKRQWLYCVGKNFFDILEHASTY